MNAHKKHHQAQTELHDDHEFNDFTSREKVLFLTRGVETAVCGLPLLRIDGDTNDARINFELAQLKLLNFKSIIDKRDLRRVSATHSGRGGPWGGPGPGRGGPGRENLVHGNGGAGRYGPGVGGRG